MNWEWLFIPELISLPPGVLLGDRQWWSEFRSSRSEVDSAIPWADGTIRRILWFRPQSGPCGAASQTAGIGPAITPWDSGRSFNKNIAHLPSRWSCPSLKSNNFFFPLFCNRLLPEILELLRFWSPSSQHGQRIPLICKPCPASLCMLGVQRGYTLGGHWELLEMCTAGSAEKSSLLISLHGKWWGLL